MLNAVKYGLLTLLIALVGGSGLAQDCEQADSLIKDIAYQKFYANNRIDSAIWYGEKGLNIAKGKNCKSSLATGNSLLGLALLRKGKLIASLDHFLSCLELRSELKDSAGISNVYLNLGSVYKDIGIHDASTWYFLESIRMREGSADSAALALGYVMYGDALGAQGRYRDALRYHRMAKSIFSSFEDSTQIGETLISIGNDYQQLDVLDSASSAFVEAHSIFVLLDGSEFHAGLWIGKCNYGLGAIQYDRENFDVAKTYFELALDFSVRDSLLAEAGIANLALGKIANETKNYGEAMRKTRESLNIFKSIGAAENEKDAYFQLAEINQRKGDNKNAYVNLLQAWTLRDSIAQESQALLVEGLIRHYESDRKDIKIRSQEDENAKLAEVSALETQRKNYTLGLLALAILLIGVITYAYFRIRSANQMLVSANEKSDALLLNILPKEIATELKEEGRVESRFYDSATVMAIDIVGFTNISDKVSPKKLVEELNICFTAFDEIISANQLEKIKTIGDAYMCAGGVPNASNTHAEDVCKSALEILVYMERRREEQTKLSIPEFHCRIGIHSGPVIAGIIGKRKFAYDIWGETVNTAFRLETAGEADKINISDDTHRRVKFNFECTPRGRIKVKHGQEIDMFFIEKESKENR